MTHEHGAAKKSEGSSKLQTDHQGNAVAMDGFFYSTEVHFKARI